jgi:5-dehydro-2-deoxygluconokinase
MTDEEAVADMAEKFGALVAVWERLGESKAA